MDPTTRAMGILVIDEGVIIRAHPQTEDRTAIELAPDILVGNIVRDPESGRWRYDEQLVNALGLDGNPWFDTDLKAGRALKGHLPPLAQVNAFARGLLQRRIDDEQRGPKAGTH